MKCRYQCTVVITGFFDVSISNEPEGTLVLPTLTEGTMGLVPIATLLQDPSDENLTKEERAQVDPTVVAALVRLANEYIAKRLGQTGAEEVIVPPTKPKNLA